MESIEQYPDPFTEEQILGDGMEIRSEVGSESEEEDGEKQKLKYGARDHRRRFLALHPPDPGDDLAIRPSEPANPFTEADENSMIHVSNLPVTTTKDDLIRLFQDLGPIKFVRLRNMKDQLVYSRTQIKGDPFMTAYVCFYQSRAQRVIKKVNNTQFMGHIITVTKPLHRICEIRVQNLPISASRAELVNTFQPLGEIYSIRIVREPGSRSETGYVTFVDGKAVELAMKMNGNLCVRGIRVKISRSKDIFKALTQKRRKGKLEMITVKEMRAGKLVKYSVPKNEESRQLLIKRAKAKQRRSIAGSVQDYQINSSDQEVANDPNWQPHIAPAPPIITGDYISFTDPPANQGRRQQQLQPGNAYLDNQRKKLLSVPLINGQVKIPRVRGRKKKPVVKEWRKEDMVWRNPNLTQ